MRDFRIVEDEQNRAFDARQKFENMGDGVADEEVGSDDADARQEPGVGVELFDEEVVVSAEGGPQCGTGESIAARQRDANRIRMEGRQDVRGERKLRSREHGWASVG